MDFLFFIFFRFLGTFPQNDTSEQKNPVGSLRCQRPTLGRDDPHVAAFLVDSLGCLGFLSFSNLVQQNHFFSWPFEVFEKHMFCL